MLVDGLFDDDSDSVVSACNRTEVPRNYFGTPPNCRNAAASAAESNNTTAARSSPRDRRDGSSRARLNGEALGEEMRCSKESGPRQQVG